MARTHQPDQQAEDEAPAVARTGKPSLQSLAQVIHSALADGASAKARAASTASANEPAGYSPASDFAATMESVRRVSETLRAAEQRSLDLQAALEAFSDRARFEISAAEERARTADERADVADEHARESEERLSQLMELIQREFAPVSQISQPQSP